mmetsp:Transcript_4385/g.5085  ORF Transcript_4385/g.5085 Transcript_4385/m.5085 type:complete len:88 (+) Transcript_4385:180-443(+)
MARPWNKLWMPSTIMKLHTTQPRNANLNKYVFQVPPSFTKLEIKEYLKKIYGMEVKRVTTVNYDGKVKRRGATFYKRPAYKKATVYL